MKSKKYAGMFCAEMPNKLNKLDYRLRKVIKELSNYNCEKILDVGCGDGNFSVLLKEACNAKELYGIEISKKGVESARKKGVKCYQLDIDEEDFPFENDYFDAIFAGEIIEHLYDPDHLLDEVYRVLKPEGVFILTTPNLSSIYNRISLFLGFQPFHMGVSLRYNIGHIINTDGVHGKDHIRLFTLRSLLYLVKIHNFYVEKIYGTYAELLGDSNRYISFILSFVDKMICRFPSLSHTIILVCKKRKR